MRTSEIRILKEPKSGERRKTFATIEKQSKAQKPD